MTDELINALANVEGLVVASRTSVFALKGRREDIRTIGAMLNVSAVLEGTVRKAGSRLRITAQLINVNDGRLLWSERFDREDTDVFAIQDEIARTIVNTLRASFLGEMGEPVPRRYTQNLKAYNFYLRGRFCWNKRTPEGISEAIEYFEQAIAEDPEYALAYTGLADSYALQLDYRAAPVDEGMRRAKEEALHAIALDDTLAEAHTSLGWVIFIHDWEWEKARNHFERSIALNPRYATGRQWYAWYLAAMGRTGEALIQGKMAIELDPASVSIRRGDGVAAVLRARARARDRAPGTGPDDEPDLVRDSYHHGAVALHGGPLPGCRGRFPGGAGTPAGGYPCDGRSRSRSDSPGTAGGGQSHAG